MQRQPEPNHSTAGRTKSRSPNAASALVRKMKGLRSSAGSEASLPASSAKKGTCVGGVGQSQRKSTCVTIAAELNKVYIKSASQLARLQSKKRGSALQGGVGKLQNCSGAQKVQCLKPASQLARLRRKVGGSVLEGGNMGNSWCEVPGCAAHRPVGVHCCSDGTRQQGAAAAAGTAQKQGTRLPQAEALVHHRR